MIEVFENTILKIDKVLDDEIVVKNNVDLELDITKYLNLNLNISVLMNSKLNLYLITNHNIRISLNINVEENSNVKVFFALFNRKSNTDVKVNLIGKNSSSNISLINLSNNNTSTHYTLINHLGEKTNSIIKNNAILNNGSSCLMDIKSKIKNKSKGSNSNQTIEGLCLDKNSKLEMIPTLYIDENDVFANHSSSVSRINERDLYYIMSKGINKEDANKMYALSFLLKVTPLEKQEIIEKMIERYI